MNIFEGGPNFGISTVGLIRGSPPSPQTHFSSALATMATLSSARTTAVRVWSTVETVCERVRRLCFCKVGWSWLCYQGAVLCGCAMKVLNCPSISTITHDLLPMGHIIFPVWWVKTFNKISYSGKVRTNILQMRGYTFG